MDDAGTQGVVAEETLSGELFSGLAEGALAACIASLVSGDAPDAHKLTEDIVASQREGENEASVRGAEAAFSACMSAFEQAARGSWTPAQLEKNLQGLALPWGDASILVELWRGEEAAAKEALRDASLTGAKLHKMSWRVDVCQSTRHVEDVGEACAIVDLELRPRRGEEGEEGNSLRFEMEREQVEAVHAEVERVRKAIARAAGGGS